VFLDTSIHVGLFLEDDPARKKGFQRIKKDSPFRVSCAFARLEYKRVVMQNLSLVLDYLSEEGTFAGALLRASRLNRSRRLSTLTQLHAWIHRRAASGTVETGDDRRMETILAERAKSVLRNAISSAWVKFEKNVDSIVDAMQCQRAREVPREKATGSYDVTVHEQACRNKRCNNANFFRSQWVTLRRLAESIRNLPTDQQTEELKEGLKAIEQAERNPSRLFDYDNCLQMGDIWHHLECLQAKVKKFATTNYRESQILCPTLNLTMCIPVGHACGKGEVQTEESEPGT
jgi:hypothetical protein